MKSKILSITVGPCEQPASLKLIDRLWADGIISAEAHHEARADLRARQPWWLWIDRMSLLLGATLILAGIIFFFAFNWAKISSAFKFAMIEALLFSSLIAAWTIGWQRLTGKICLMAGTILVGVFLAVFGQVYQTGADAYQLFGAWSLLIFGWVLISCFPGLWIAWITLVNTTLILYWNQAMLFENDTLFTLLYLLLGGFNSTILILREFLLPNGHNWLKSSWPRRLLLTSILFYLGLPTLMFIFEKQHHFGIGFLAVVLFMIIETGTYFFYRYRSYDLAALALSLLAANIVILTLCGRLLFDISDKAGAFLVMALMVVAVFGFSTLWLLKIRKSFVGAEHD